MTRRSLIRRPSRGIFTSVARNGVAIAFWFSFALAVTFGGGYAFDGLPALAGAVLPQAMPEAQAAGEGPANAVAMALHGRASPSPFAPELLTPVVAHDFPDWLTQRAGDEDTLSLRGFESGSDAAATYATVAASRPSIALVIDDLGSDVEATRRAIHLPAAVTLSFLPYPVATPGLAHDAEQVGHQVLVHVPMEPEGRDDPGPHALLTGLSAEEIARRLSWALARVPGFSGVNNHMGSRFTADRTALVPVVEMLADRHIFFLDSKTTPNSVVVALAHAFGVASAARDVFLDDEQTEGSVDAQLALTERIARAQGIAIAIGHPHATTLTALEKWLAQLHGFDLVPVATAIRLKTERAVLVSARE